MGEPEGNRLANVGHELVGLGSARVPGEPHARIVEHTRCGRSTIPESQSAERIVRVGICVTRSFRPVGVQQDWHIAICEHLGDAVALLRTVHDRHDTSLPRDIQGAVHLARPVAGHQDERLRLQGHAQRLECPVVLRPFETTWRVLVDRPGLVVVSGIEERLFDVRYRAHQRVGETSKPRSSLQIHAEGHRCAHDHVVRPLTGEVDERRLTREQPPFRRYHCGCESRVAPGRDTIVVNIELVGGVQPGKRGRPIFRSPRERRTPRVRPPTSTTSGSAPVPRW